MTITISIPDNLESLLRSAYGTDIERRVLEDLAVAWFQSGLISAGKVAEILNFDRSDADDFLKARGVTDQITVDDVFEQVDAFRSDRDRPQP